MRGLLLSNADNKSVSTAMTIIFLDLHFFFSFHFVFCVFVTWQHYVAVAWLWCRSMRPKAIDIDAIGGAIHLCLRIATFCWHPSYCCSHFLCCSFSFSYALTTFFLESVGLLVCFFFFFKYCFVFSSSFSVTCSWFTLLDWIHCDTNTHYVSGWTIAVRDDDITFVFISFICLIFFSTANNCKFS